MTLKPRQIKQIVEEYLSVLYPRIEEVEITFLVKDEESGMWKVNTRFKTSGWLHYIALLKINADGEVVEYKEGWGWRF